MLTVEEAAAVTAALAAEGTGDQTRSPGAKPLELAYDVPIWR